MPIEAYARGLLKHAEETPKAPSRPSTPCKIQSAKMTEYNERKERAMTSSSLLDQSRRQSPVDVSDARHPNQATLQ